MPDPILTYSYNELSDEIKQKITEKLWDINVFDDFWFEPTLDYWKEKLTDDLAISKVDIFFDLHRRDGTYFTGYVNDLEKFLKETKIEYNHDLDDLWITFTKDGIETPFMITQLIRNCIFDWKNQICSQLLLI